MKFKAIALHRDNIKIHFLTGIADSWEDAVHQSREYVVKKAHLKKTEYAEVSVFNIDHQHYKKI